MKKFSAYIVLLMASVLFGCRGAGSASDGDDVLIVGKDTIDSVRLARTIDSLIERDYGHLAADKATRAFYKANHHLMWLSNEGVTPQADTLLSYLRSVGDIGFDPSHFFPEEIAADKQRVDSLDFSESDVYTIIARMDMLLTKAFLRYEGNLHYGVCRPSKIFNNVDRNMSVQDTSVVIFRQLYDIPTEQMGPRGYAHLASLAGTDSVTSILRNTEPQSPLYRRLKDMLRTARGTERDRILVNMERCRWRHPHYPCDYDKYILVNVPSYKLIGVDADSTLEMRIVCGSYDTKTPLVHSFIKRMDLNPQWVLPGSIVRHDIARHAGNTSYFERHRYHIYERATGKEISPARVTYDWLMSGDFRVAQEGGEGNALGRVIFRFDNNFSIYLHDTSTKGTFSRDDRRASHGCIRVQRPYDLACFLLQDKDEDLMEKIKYSMTATHIKPPQEGENPEDTDYDPALLISNVKLKPQVPLFITYYTMYLLPDGTLQTYPDVYAYDPIILDKLQAFISPR